MKHGKHRKPDWRNITLRILFWILFIITMLETVWEIPDKIWVPSWLTLLTVWAVWSWYDGTHRGEHRK